MKSLWSWFEVKGWKKTGGLLGVLKCHGKLLVLVMENKSHGRIGGTIGSRRRFLMIDSCQWRKSDLEKFYGVLESNFNKQILLALALALPCSKHRRKSKLGIQICDRRGTIKRFPVVKKIMKAKVKYSELLYSRR